MSKWTPGPWRLREECATVVDMGGFFVDSEDVDQIAFVWRNCAPTHPGFGSKNAFADAALISAAPDLAEALEAALEEHGKSVLFSARTLALMESALDKAKGVKP